MAPYKNIEKIKLEVYSITGDSFCIAAVDGEKIFEKIKEALDKGIQIDLSFQYIKMLTPAFFNTAIGQIYGQFTETEIQSRLSIFNIKDEDKLLLKRVINTAKTYYKNPVQFENSINMIMNSWIYLDIQTWK